MTAVCPYAAEQYSIPCDLALICDCPCDWLEDWEELSEGDYYDEDLQ